MRRRLALAGLVCLGLTGCGSATPDLFRVQREGTGPGARLDLVVSDTGMARCNRGGEHPIGDDRLLVARQLARDLAPQATLGLALPAGPKAQTAFRYEAEIAEGQVSFADSSPKLPRSFVTLAGFTRQVARGACGLKR